MRFSEFKLIEQDQKAGFYTVGDSHAVGLANYAGKPWISKARNGTRSTDPMHKAAIASIPKGSTVAISLGANDAQDVRANPQAVATNVAGVVNAAKQQGLKVHFLLFPVGSKPNGEFRAKVREAIKAAIDVPVVDLEGSRLLDGVHADASAYKKAASSIVSASPLGPSSATPGNVPTKDKGQAAQPGSFSVDVPNSRRGPAVADVQKALVALGYPLPKHGVDGIRGPETVAAVKQFQQANNLTVDGDPGKETVAKLNATLAAKPEVAAKLTKSTAVDVKSKPSNSSLGAPSVGAIEVNDENTAAAKTSAEKFLGRAIDDNEWNYLIRAVVSEASPNTKEQAYVMGVILNRARSGKWGDSIVSVLNAKNQFQAVTGTRYDPGPSANFTRGPNKNQLASILKGAIEILPQVDKSLMNFTAASTAAYGPGTNLGFRDTLLAKGGQQIGGTIFA